jgi:autotransporter-associated beta strand protein
LALAVLVLLGSQLESFAAVRFWDGSANGNFSTGANWVGDAAPVAGDDLVFQAGVTRLLVTNDFSPNRAFNTVLFQGSNYFVRGSALLVTNGISSINPVGTNRIEADVNVRASQSWEAQGVLGVLDVNGDINLNANTLTVRANTGDFNFSGVVTGAGNLVKTNVGTLRLDGTGHNTYTGFTRFDGGVLELEKLGIVSVVPLILSNFVAIPGELIVGDGNGLVGTDVLRLQANDQIADTSAVTVKNSGLIDLNNNSDRIGSLTMQGGTVETGTGVLFLGGNVSTITDSNTALIEGHLSLGGESRTFFVAPGPPIADLRINATISADTGAPLGTAGLTKTGPGTLFLTATNTYNGITTVDEGQLAVLSDRALGATAALIGAAAAGTVVNGNGNLFVSGVQVTNEALTINSSNPGGAFNASGAAVWTGNILLNADTFIASSTSLLLSGTITGSGGFTKIGFGSLTLAGTNANTYSGATRLRDGTLLLAKDTTAVLNGAMSGPLIIGEDELPENTDIVLFVACCQLPDDTDVTMNASGLLDLNGFGQNVRNLIFNGGDVDAPPPGSILPAGDVTVNANANSRAVISGRMSVLSNPIFNVTGHSWSPDLRISAQLYGAGGLTKNGPGELGLDGANTYSGLTTVNDGLLIVNASSALGSVANGTVVNSGAALSLNSDVHVVDESLTLSGPGDGAFGALHSASGSNSWSGAITLSSSATISVDAGDFLNLTGPITAAAPANLTKVGTGTLLFSGSAGNSYDETFVNAGTLVLAKSLANAGIPGDLTIGDGTGTDVVRLGADNQILDTAKIHLQTGGRLDLNDLNETAGSVDGGGLIDLGSGSFRAGADDASSLYSGIIVGSGNLFKLGTGTWTLSGNNTYSGATTVSAGALVVNGSQPQSHVAVNGTATLMGSGVVGSLQVFGLLRPGSSPAILTCSNVSFAAQADYFVELNGPTPGRGHDQLNVRGTNQLGGSTLHLSVGAGFAPAEGEDFVILNNDGSEAIQGTFAGLPNGSLITANGLQFRIRYSAIFENDVVLTVTNTAARLVGSGLFGGNGDGNIDVNECNFLQVAVTNVTGGTLSGVVGTLVSKTPGVSVTSGTSPYPSMASGARGTNTVPFQFSTGPAFACGRFVEFELVLQTPANGTFAIPISLVSGSAGTPVRFSNNTLTTIPDNGTVDLPITVAGLSTPLKQVAVSLHITHTAASDLDISLVGPDGTIVGLSSDNGGTASDYGTDCIDDSRRTVFLDTAATSITSASAPFVGTFRPEQPLAAFNEKTGSAVNGVWRLRVADDTPGGVGSIRCWSLQLSPTACGNQDGGCESCPENRLISGVISTNGPGNPAQLGRLERDGVASVCSVAKACPGFVDLVTARHYDAFVFENGESNACITVTLTSDGELFSASYSNQYNPASLCQNYLADAGGSVVGGPRSYSFRVSAGARFVVVVNEVNPGTDCAYTVRVSGGSCRPRLNINPVADNRVTLNWSSSALGYLLEQTNVLRNPPASLWVPVPGTPTISSGRFRVTDSIPPGATNKFYRLRRP